MFRVYYGSSLNKTGGFSVWIQLNLSFARVKMLKVFLCLVFPAASCLRCWLKQLSDVRHGPGLWRGCPLINLSAPWYTLEPRLIYTLWGMIGRRCGSTAPALRLDAAAPRMRRSAGVRGSAWCCPGKTLCPVHSHHRELWQGKTRAFHVLSRTAQLALDGNTKWLAYGRTVSSACFLPVCVLSEWMCAVGRLTVCEFGKCDYVRGKCDSPFG